MNVLHQLNLTQLLGLWFTLLTTLLSNTLKLPVLVFMSKLGTQNPLFPPTPTTSLLMQLHLCTKKWSLCSSVPKGAVPCPTNLFVQISSIGQDSNAAAEPPAQEYTADSDQTLLIFFPLTPGVSRAFHYLFVPYWSLQPIFLLLLSTTWRLWRHHFGRSLAPPGPWPTNLRQHHRRLVHLQKYFVSSTLQQLTSPSPVFISQLCLKSPLNDKLI